MHRSHELAPAGVEDNAWVCYQWDTVFEFCAMILDAREYAGLDIGPYVELIEKCLAFYDDFGRGMDGMQLPYVTECFRAVVGIQPKTIRQDTRPDAATTPPDSEAGSGADPEQTTGAPGEAGESTVPLALASAIEPPFLLQYECG